MVNDLEKEAENAQDSKKNIEDEAEFSEDNNSSEEEVESCNHDALNLKIAHLESNLFKKEQQFEVLEKRFRQLIADSTESEKNWKRRMDFLKENSISLEEAVNLLDFLAMGLAASASSPQVHEGMQMAYNCCLEIFKKKNIEVVEVKKGDIFDSSIHKVIGVMPDEQVEAGKIISGRPGYVFLSGGERRALKHAEVILSEDKAVN